jgi:hypothetical protein
MALVRRDGGEEAWHIARELGPSISPLTTDEAIARFRSRRAGFLHSLRTGRLEAQHLQVDRLPRE